MKRTEIVYYYRGLVERGKDYHWVGGWSISSPEGYVQYPWITRREAQILENKAGCKAVFVR